ncbi:MAG: valine--tRNA ligase [Elusimicrobia bacterium]|nr:valine--tRNA ligase [Elusimicrobiota bacterium]
MLDKAYDPKPIEAKWLELWHEARLFRSVPSGNPDKFTIVIPPPNVTGALHLGHALNNTLQDVLIRWYRLHGYETCWVPGTDHGGIATQNVMERQLKAEGKSRHELGREKFLERMQSWTRDCKKTILGQLRRLGCALDWDREAFTMDEPRAKAVFKAFQGYWDSGLIERTELMINWCVRCGTALSDDEVEYEERKGALWHIHYPAESGGKGLIVATTRPETMLGDTGVAVHPSDERYRGLIGKKVRLPLTGRLIPVVADDQVDPSFGTGAVKVTPAHDRNDYEIGRRHKLPSMTVIGRDGHILPECGVSAYAGLHRDEARKRIVADLENLGFLEKKEDYKHSVVVCYRCGQTIEPLVSMQWFLHQERLAPKTLEAFDGGRFRISPDNWAKPYRDWLSKIRPWVISRQIWWGHRIPVWYCSGCHGSDITHVGGEPVYHGRARKGDYGIVVSWEKPSRSCENGHSASWIQDGDVLDTWFSSALWPMSVFGWPDGGEQLRYYYPTQVLVTGYEILYLWVARMQMSGIEFLKAPPFSQAIIHGIVRDKSGKKMSKSLGNVIDPLEMMEKYGTDALRFALILQAHPGRDIPFAEDSILGSRNFANKLWNSTRFVLMNLPDSPSSGAYRLESLSHGGLELADRWILSEYQKAISKARDRMKERNVAAAADALYEFLWDKYCDWYVELAKIRLQGADGPSKEAVRAILIQVLSGMLKLLHPFMPYITEELFSALKPYSEDGSDFLYRARAPETAFDWSNPQAELAMAALTEMVDSLRSLRAQLNIAPGLKLRVCAAASGDGARRLIEDHSGYLNFLARLESIEFWDGGTRPPQSATAVSSQATFFVPLKGLIDFAKEKIRLEKELSKCQSELQKIAAKAENKEFLARAPQAEIETARSQYESAKARLGRLKDTLAVLAQS